MTDKWVIVDDLKADPGKSMAVVSDEKYRRECVTKNLGIPVYTREELALIKGKSPSAPVFREVQKVKRVFHMARVLK